MGADANSPPLRPSGHPVRTAEAWLSSSRLDLQCQTGPKPAFIGSQLMSPDLSFPRQRSLFEEPRPDGLKVAVEQLAAAEETELISRIEGMGLVPFRFQQWLGKRESRSFGWNYDFQTGNFARTDPIPAWLEPLRKKVAEFARVPLDNLEQVILLRYGADAGIGWHRDRSVFGEVMGVSLGTEATLRFRRRSAAGFIRAHVPLAPRSFYLLSGEARNEWDHSIQPTGAPRWSITFRTLAMKGSH